MMRNFKPLRGCTLAAADGEIGKVREMLFDDQQWTVRYLVVDAGSWLVGRDVLVAPRALGEVDVQQSRIAVSLTQDQVRESPSIETDKPVSRQYEEMYYRHYSWDPYWVVPGADPGLVMAPPRAMPEPGLPDSLQPEVPPEPAGDPHLRSSDTVTGYSIHAQDGDLGHISDFIIDDTDWRVRYLVVDTRNWWPGKHVLLAPEWIERISFESGKVFVNLPSSTIKQAPEYDSSAPISRSYEESMHDHYGYKTYWKAVGDSASSGK